MHRMMSTTTTSTQKLLFVAVIFQNTVDEDDAGDDGNDTDRREINAVVIPILYFQHVHHCKTLVTEHSARLTNSSICPPTL